jgi:hypothetical protein
MCVLRVFADVLFFRSVRRPACKCMRVQEEAKQNKKARLISPWEPPSGSRVGDYYFVSTMKCCVCISAHWMLGERETAGMHVRSQYEIFERIYPGLGFTSFFRLSKLVRSRNEFSVGEMFKVAKNKVHNSNASRLGPLFLPLYELFLEVSCNMYFPSWGKTIFPRCRPVNPFRGERATKPFLSTQGVINLKPKLNGRLASDFISQIRQSRQTSLPSSAC